MLRLRRPEETPRNPFGVRECVACPRRATAGTPLCSQCWTEIQAWWERGDMQRFDIMASHLFIDEAA